ncbi:MAG: hypothetical protein KDB53_02155, partial [Planctomycetes bacterium]|nr:hypothetical protein [Planctomycetota bacterium]
MRRIIGQSGWIMALAILSIASASGQTTRLVGAGQPYTTIQAAIVASQPGDTVLVAPGTYSERIDFGGRDIRVRSSGGPAVTIIAAGRSGTVVELLSGESSLAVLEGFTITGGRGTQDVNGSFPFSGGGIAIDSSATIRNCRITNNETPEIGTSGDGGGIFCFGGSPTIINCQIDHNRTATPQVQEMNGTPAGRGAGVFIGANATATLIGCVIRDNRCGDGASPSPDPGGAPSSGGTGGDGGGVWGAATLVNCLIFGNRCGDGGNGTALPALPSYGPNGRGGRGGGVFGPATLINCTVADNEAGFGGANGGFIPGTDGDGGALFGAVFVVNSILWQNLPDQVQGSVTITHSDVQGGYAGTGNIDLDPVFVGATAGDYHLGASSPCRNAGDSTAVTALTDFEGDPRRIAVVDQGADEDTQVYPGTNEGLLFSTSGPTIRFPDAQVKFVTEGAFLETAWSAQGSVFTGSFTVLLAQAFGTGPLANGPLGYSSVHLVPFRVPAPTLIYTAPPLG